MAPIESSCVTVARGGQVALGGGATPIAPSSGFEVSTTSPSWPRWRRPWLGLISQVLNEQLNHALNTRIVIEQAPAATTSDWWTWPRTSSAALSRHQRSILRVPQHRPEPSARTTRVTARWRPRAPTRARFGRRGARR